MAVTYGFYNSMNHDRRYNAEQVGAMFDGLIADGVFETVGDGLMTIPGEGMQVIVKSGRAWFNRTWTLNDAQLPLSIEPADSLLNRIDAVVLEVDTRPVTRANSIKIVKGVLSGEPSKPSMVNAEGLYQHALAYVTVDANATNIEAGKIEVVVGKSKETPFVTGIIETVDISDLFQQWNGQFDLWFNNVKAQLSGSVAENLQRQIDTLESDKVNVSDKASSEDAKAGTSDTKWMTPKGVRESLSEGIMVDGETRKIRTGTWFADNTHMETLMLHPRYSGGWALTEDKQFEDCTNKIYSSQLYNYGTGLKVGDWDIYYTPFVRYAVYNKQYTYFAIDDANNKLYFLGIASLVTDDSSTYKVRTRRRCMMCLDYSTNKREVSVLDAMLDDLATLSNYYLHLVPTDNSHMSIAVRPDNGIGSYCLIDLKSGKSNYGRISDYNKENVKSLLGDLTDGGFGSDLLPIVTDDYWGLTVEGSSSAYTLYAKKRGEPFAKKADFTLSTSIISQNICYSKGNTLYFKVVDHDGNIQVQKVTITDERIDAVTANSGLLPTYTWHNLDASGTNDAVYWSYICTTTEGIYFIAYRSYYTHWLTMYNKAFMYNFDTNSFDAPITDINDSNMIWIAMADPSPTYLGKDDNYIYLKGGFYINRKTKVLRNIYKTGAPADFAPNYHPYINERNYNKVSTHVGSSIPYNYERDINVKNSKIKGWDIYSSSNVENLFNGFDNLGNVIVTWPVTDAIRNWQTAFDISGYYVEPILVLGEITEDSPIAIYANSSDSAPQQINILRLSDFMDTYLY